MTKPRPRGAQPKNSNALKHGFYSSHHPSALANPLLDFNDQITRLRDHATRLIDRLEKAADPIEIINIQRAIDLCTLSISRLTRMHLIGNPADLEQLEATYTMSRLMREALIAFDPNHPALSSEPPQEPPA